jgi:(1->4)-alpha-D-glucan 1-alpha-D-glucosylmutase
MTIDDAPSPRIPVSTYRLQFNHRFTLTDAARLIPYLKELGITDVYASPCFKAQKRSIHGYDIVDPTMVNPELGGDEGYARFVTELKNCEMGLILDIVPNHMYVESEENRWWMDVLENGPGSLYADFFDIDWGPAKKELENKVLIPILGDQYGTVLERRELNLNFEKGAFFLCYYEHRLPIIPETYVDILRPGIDKLRAVLDPDHPDLTEFLSIIVALSCLPSYLEREAEKATERNREKEIVKKRLGTLSRKSPVIRSFIDNNILMFNGTSGDHQSFNLLDELLNKQAWRLSYWRVATEEINYRRFFDINSLAAIHTENPIVFQKTHHLVFRLIQEGSVTGLRVDHPDGLYDPFRYLKDLQRECFSRIRINQIVGSAAKGALSGESYPDAGILKEYEEIMASDPQFKPFYIIGEKILTKGELVPEDWPIFGTIGYVFLNSLNGIFVDMANSRAFDEIYAKFIGSKLNYQDLVREKKKLIMLTAMSAEINTLSHYLNRISEKNRHTRDFTLNSLRNAVMDVIACFPVYRTYITQDGWNDSDRRYIEYAVSKAKRGNPAMSASTFDFLQDILLRRYPEESLKDADRIEWVDFAMRFQQVTGPVMAKGLEDTVFYVYNRLVSLNEVGGNPERFGTPLGAFHGQNIEAVKLRPYSLITTSTHDTKRSEDVRARLNVLSEIPDDWRRHLVKWRRLNKKMKPLVDGRPVPDRNEEYLMYQTLLGAWPMNQGIRTDHGAFKTRIMDYMVKAVREAKINSSWISPDEPYEEALKIFIDAVLSWSASNAFLKDLIVFEEKISYLGMLNSLSQTLFKIMSPGVPDFYQGTEVWDLSLVDPDNRKPVNFDMRKRVLRRLRSKMASSEADRASLARGLLKQWRDGTIKLYVTFVALNHRKENDILFKDGTYIPLTSKGILKDHVCAFARHWQGRTVLAIVPRFLTQVVKTVGAAPLGTRAWGDVSIILPDEITHSLFRNTFTHETIRVIDSEGQRILTMGDVFANFPVAMLEGK